MEPIDYASRVVNGKTHLPPLHVRRQAGPLAGLENSGAEFVTYLKLLCGLTPSSRILDIGCGFGLLALYLNGFLDSGRYVGVDVDGRAINWASRHIASQNPRFEFQHLDVRNPAYNAGGSAPAENVTLPLDPGSFDIIVLKSVFTHLRPNATRNYLKEVKRLLVPTGVCLATFFVLDEVADDTAKPALDFAFGEGDWRYAVRDMPELAIAYMKTAVSNMAAASDLAIDSVHPGTWSGPGGGLSYQDILILSPA